MERKTKRLVADLPIDMHNELKILATTRNITLSKLVIQSLIARINFEKQFLKEENDSVDISNVDANNR